MTWTEIILFSAALLVMIIGQVGIILPFIPGVPMIFGAALIYAILTDFAVISAQTVIIFAILAVFSVILDWIATALGVKKMGGSYFGMFGAFLGMILGLLLPGVGVIGFIIGAFVGAFLFETLLGKESKAAFKAGLGSFIGFLAGGVLKFVIGAAMIGVFIWQVLF
ncbi:MAG: DUF456 domain-containing protein [candidate division Zixibacteria bacterium]